MDYTKIVSCRAAEILDSRGNPTVKAYVELADGSIGTASIPSGASTGIFEALELRDYDLSRYGGKGVMTAVENVNTLISKALCGKNAFFQAEIDQTMLDLDGTEEKRKLGANAILAVSLASSRACANSLGVPLYRYLGGSNAFRIPVPMMNILNGGAHAFNNVEIQEFMISPVGASSFAEGLQICSEIYHTLAKLLKKKNLATGVGDEGGYAPNLENDELALDFICEAIAESGYSTDLVKIALDCAASEWYDEKDGSYHLPKRKQIQTRQELIAKWQHLVETYPIFSIEDGLDQQDFDGWQLFTQTLGRKVLLVGDDLFATNPKRLQKGISKSAGNAILVKPNQIGSLSEVFEVIRMASDAGFAYIPSHRSGDTEDTFLADLSVALNAPFIKTGAPCRSERVAKYNRLLEISTELAPHALFGNYPLQK